MHNLEAGSVAAVGVTPMLSGADVPYTRKVNRARSWRDAQQAGQSYDLGSIERSIKMGFVRKVYSILATQLAVTVAIVMGFIYAAFVVENGAPNPAQLTGFGQWTVDNWWVQLALLLPVITCICCLQGVKNSYPANYLLLCVFTVLESLTIGFICVYFYAAGYGSEILLAFGITLAIFCVLTLFTMQSSIDWSFLGAGIFCALFVLIFWSWFTFWLTPADSFVPRQLFSLGGAIVFSLFIVYDTNNIMKHFGVDDYIIAAIELYLDVINLFLYLLQFLALTGGGRD